MKLIEVDQETLNLIDKYNDLTNKWLTGVEWLSNPNLTEVQFKKGEERLRLRLRQLSAVYEKLIVKGIEPVPEEYIDVNRYVLKPPF